MITLRTCVLPSRSPCPPSSAPRSPPLAATTSSRPPRPAPTRAPSSPTPAPSTAPPTGRPRTRRRTRTPGPTPRSTPDRSPSRSPSRRRWVRRTFVRRPAPGLGTGALAVEPKDFRFYVSRVRLVRQDDVDVPVTLDVAPPWQTADVALLDFEDATGSCVGNAETNGLVKGRVPAGAYKGVVFDLGIPEALNHGNPATAPSPLNVMSMSWSWLSVPLREDRRAAVDGGGAAPAVLRASAAPTARAIGRRRRRHVRAPEPARRSASVGSIRRSGSSSTTRPCSPDRTSPRTPAAPRAACPARATGAAFERLGLDVVTGCPPAPERLPGRVTR